jgi:hypothetical protein
MMGIDTTGMAFLFSARIFLAIEPVKEASGMTVTVRKTAYCDVHAPADSDCTPMLNDSTTSEEEKTADAQSYHLPL